MLPKGDQLSDQNKATQTEPPLKNNIHISLRLHALFQKYKSFKLKPPSSFEFVTDVQETLAEWCLSEVPFQINALHNELIVVMHFFGRINVLDQKFDIPAITELRSCNLPANNKDFT